MKRRSMVHMAAAAAAAACGGVARVSADRRDGEDATAPSTKGLASHYLDISRAMLARMHDTQSAYLLEGAYAIASAVKKGGRVWSNWNMGHNTEFDVYPGRHGAPDFVTVNYVAEKAKKGDVLLVTYYSGPMEDVVKKGVYVIGGPDPYSLDGHGEEPFRDDLVNARFRQYANIWIDTGSTRVDGAIELPGAPVPVCPVSPVLGMTSFWMMMADACRILARDDVKVQIAGDEPRIPDGNPKSWEPNARASLDSPLMERYFRRIMDEQRMIVMEMGKIHKIAGMVVDTVLSGGRAYCYSRNRNQLAVEGTTRRGGLALFNGIFDGGAEKDFVFINAFVTEKPFSPKDCVVVGFTIPDDPVDLENLAKFRKAGMKIASIGPMTRDFKVPEGDTIPKKTDIHAGSMCDTYGLFAIPGFGKKACPTSGAMVNQIFWAVCADVVEQFYERTGGDVPGVYGNVAVEGGRPLMRHMVELYKERGY